MKNIESLLRYMYILLASLFMLMAIFSCKRLKVEDADRKFAEGEYFEAGDIYRNIYRDLAKKDRVIRAEVAYRMAEAYRLANRPQRALTAYANALRYDAEDDVVMLQYARTLHKLGKYEEAEQQYNAFLALYPTNRYAINGFMGAKMSQKWKKNPNRYIVKPMDVFNSNRGEFAPALLPPDYEQIFFASNRKGVKGDSIASGITGAALNDIFMSRRDENGEWMRSEHLQSAINTEGDEGGISFLADGSMMYYSSSPADSIGSGQVSIYMSRRSEGEWGVAEKLGINKRDTTNVYAHPAISPRGDYLYFVSDMSGGYGGKDIWRARLLGDLVEFVENIGPEINTAGDEMFPYVRNDSTLYFASDGHIGMGGLDILEANYSRKNNSWTIKNMAYPINSEGDDFGITFYGEKDAGYFSTNRGDARGFDHIYSFELPEIASRIEGYLVDTDDEFQDSVTVRVVGRDGTNMKIQGRVDGSYTMEVKQGIDYVLLASREGYLNAKQSLTTVRMNRDSVYFVDFILSSMEGPVGLENVFYEFDQSTLTEGSRKDLDNLIALLNTNPHVTIELTAHTDRKGTDEYNRELSQRRAESVVDYLIKGGIATDRLKAVGKGKEEPKLVTKGIERKYIYLKEGDVLTEVFIDKLSPEQQEIADQINRRTEFQVTRMDYNLK